MSWSDAHLSRMAKKDETPDKDVESDVERYLREGGTIEQVDHNVSGFDALKKRGWQTNPFVIKRDRGKEGEKP